MSANEAMKNGYALTKRRKNQRVEQQKTKLNWYCF